MAFNLGNLAPLAGLLESDKLKQQRDLNQYNMILKGLAARQAQQQIDQTQQEQQALGLIGKALPQIPQQDSPFGGMGGGQPAPLMPQQQAGDQVLPQGPGAVKGSWFGNAPGWRDPSDSGLQASGQPVSAGPGIALPSRTTLGQQFDVTAPSGKTMTLPQTDVGPAARTGRGVDINAPAAEAMGYTPQNFPTDQQFIVRAHRQLDTDLDQKGFRLIQQGVPGPAVQDSTKLGMQAGREINPVEWGRATRNQLIQAIDKADPSAPDAVKALAFLQLNKILAPEEKIQAQMWAKENQQALQVGLAELRARTAERGQDMATQRELMREEFRAAQSGGSAGGGIMAGKPFEYVDKDGNPQTVMLRERKNQAGYIAADTGEPWTLPEGAKGFKQVTASTSGGGRAGAQVGRQIIGGAEVAIDLQNVKDMPVGTTTGLFGSVTPGTSLTGALKGDLARQLTKEDEINLKQAMSGVGRELSTLMSPVYGGNWASEQLEPLIPKAGYTINNALYGIARIKQAATNALRGLDASPMLGADQKKLVKDLRAEMETAIPWDVKDVNAWLRDKNPKESFGDYVKRSGVQGASGRAERGEAVRPGSSSPADIQQLQRQLAPENWSRLTPEQQADVARQVDELEKVGGARGN